MDWLIVFMLAVAITCLLKILAEVMELRKRAENMQVAIMGQINILENIVGILAKLFGKDN